MTVSQDKVRNDARKIFLRQLAVGVLFCLIGTLWQKNNFSSLVIGALSGLSDGFFFLKAVVAGMTKGAKEARQGMHISMLWRLGVMVIMVCMLKAMDGSILPTLLCYLCLHLTLMFNMTLFSPKNKELM